MRWIFLEVFEDLYCFMNRSGYSFLPAVIPGTNGQFPFRVFLYQFPRRFFERSTSVLLVIPFGRADVFEKPCHLFLGFENFAIEVSWIPINENSAKVKNYSIY